MNLGRFIFSWCSVLSLQRFFIYLIDIGCVKLHSCFITLTASGNSLVDTCSWQYSRNLYRYLVEKLSAILWHWKKIDYVSVSPLFEVSSLIVYGKCESDRENQRHMSTLAIYPSVHCKRWTVLVWRDLWLNHQSLQPSEYSYFAKLKINIWDNHKV